MNTKHYKITLLGDGNVGKTTYMNFLENGENGDYRFKKEYVATEDCYALSIPLKVSGNNVKIHLFDTAGQEKFNELRESYIFGSDAIILFYDITNEKSKNNIVWWIKHLQQLFANSRENKVVPITICANKTDKLKNREENMYLWTFSDLTKYYNYGPINIVQTSIKNRNNLKEPIKNNVLSLMYPYAPLVMSRQRTCQFL
jgi:small GTP-binding protein